MLRILSLISCFFLFTSTAFGSIQIQEEDGAPTTWPWALKVTNGTLTDNGDGTTSLSIAGGGSGSMTTVKENDVQVGGADIVTLDFLGADFDLTESPDTEIQVVINDAGIDHDATTNFVANEHLDWTASVGTIHADNYTDTDTNLTQEEVEDFAGALVANATGTHTGVAITYQDATGDMDFVVDHDAATNFLAAEHVDWAGASAGTIHATNYVDNNTTYVSSDFTHDDLTGFVANEHIDWTGASAGTIHATNYVDNDTTYTGGTNLTLAGTTFNVDDAFLLNTGDTSTGELVISGGNALKVEASSGTNFASFSSATTTANFPRMGILLGDGDGDIANGAVWAAPSGSLQETTTLEALTNTDTSLTATKRTGIRTTTTEHQWYGARADGSDSDIPINIYPNGLSGAVAMSFQTDGDIGIGTESPTQDLDIVASGSMGFAGTAILSDSAGTMTLSNVDALDATTTTTIDNAVTHTTDTTLNLAGAETITGNWVNTTNPWADNEVADDITITNISQVGDITATASEINTPLDGALVTLTEFQELETIGATVISSGNWTGVSNLSGTNTGDESTATTSAEGVVELATIAETDTGTDTARVVTPDGLAGSIYGRKTATFVILDSATATSVADNVGSFTYTIPVDMNGMNITDVECGVETAGTTSTTDIQIHNLTSAADILSTKCTIDSAEVSSLTAATAPVINTAEDDVATGDRIRFDVDAISTTPANGLWVQLTFETP